VVALQGLDLSAQEVEMIAIRRPRRVVTIEDGRLAEKLASH